jgi:hypothetical protein
VRAANLQTLLSRLSKKHGHAGSVPSHAGVYTHLIWTPEQIARYVGQAVDLSRRIVDEHSNPTYRKIHQSLHYQYTAAAEKQAWIFMELGTALEQAELNVLEMVMALTVSSLTRNHLKKYHSAEAFGRLRLTDMEGGANIHAPLSQGMSYSSGMDPRTWSDVQSSTDPVKQEYCKIRLQEAVAYQVVSNALRNDNILNALQNDVVFPTQLKYR